MNHFQKGYLRSNFICYTYIERANWNFKGTGRIIGGRPRLETESAISWQVARLSQHGLSKWPRYSAFCGGSLLNKKYILSAAHCGPVTQDRKKVLIGGKNGNNMYHSGKTHLLSNECFEHPKFEEFRNLDTGVTSGTILIYDFMILVLQYSLKSLCPSNFVRLPKKSADTNLVRNALMAVGWGRTLPLTHEDIIKLNKDRGILPLERTIEMKQVDLFYLSEKVPQNMRFNAT